MPPRLTNDQTGTGESTPYLDPCLPAGLTDMVQRNGQTVFLRGLGDWQRCQETVRPLLGQPNGTASLRGAYQAPVDHHNSEFYGFSEFYYCTEDVLRISGQYDSGRFSRAAAVTVCLTRPYLLRRPDPSHSLWASRCLDFTLPPVTGLLRHQVVDIEAAAGQQAFLHTSRPFQTEVRPGSFQYFFFFLFILLPNLLLITFLPDTTNEQQRLGVYAK